MKYIDADLLRKEIERRREANKRQYHSSTGGMSWQRMCGEEDCLVELLAFLDSLQQEQPDFPTTDEQMKEFLTTHPKIKVPEKYKNPDWLLNRQEQPNVDLDEEITNFIQSHYHIRYDNTLENGNDPLTVFDFEDIACHFAEWQYQKDRGEFAKIKAKTWCEGFDAYKEQMLKDAYVESQIVEDGRIELEGEPLPCLNPIIILPYSQFKPGDKVHIIVLKDESK